MTDYERYRDDAIRLNSLNPVDVLRLLMPHLPHPITGEIAAKINVDDRHWTCRLKFEVEAHTGDSEQVWNMISLFFTRRGFKITLVETGTKRRAGHSGFGSHAHLFDYGSDLIFKALLEPDSDLSVSFLYD